jgi:serine/threonine protein kinase
MIFEYHKNDLRKYLDSLPPKTLLSSRSLKYILRQILIGIAIIHQNQIVHRDLKLENILIDDNCTDYFPKSQSTRESRGFWNGTRVYQP